MDAVKDEETVGSKLDGEETVGNKTEEKSDANKVDGEETVENKLENKPEERKRALMEAIEGGEEAPKPSLLESIGSTFSWIARTVADDWTLATSSFESQSEEGKEALARFEA